MIMNQIMKKKHQIFKKWLTSCDLLQAVNILPYIYENFPCFYIHKTT